MVTLASRLPRKAQRRSSATLDLQLCPIRRGGRETGRERKMERAVRLPAELLFLPPHSPTIPHPQYAAGRGWKSCLAAETRSPSFDESYVPALASILPLPPPSLPHFAGRTTSNKGSLLACCSIILPKKTSNGAVRGSRSSLPSAFLLRCRSLSGRSRR